ncbi:13219_t:CDS:2, partial [Funneliformis geosporum]
GNREDLPCFGWISYRKTLSNETKAKVRILQSLGLRICQYQEVEGSLAISDWDVIIVQVESTHRIELHRRRLYVIILDEVNAIMRQMSSGTHARESENALRDLLKSAIHVLYDPDKGSEAMRRGLKILREGISNIKTGVYVEAFTQMLYRIQDCPQCIIFLYNSKKSFEIFQEPNHNLIRVGLFALRPIDLPTAVKGHREWDKIADCYALDASLAVETYIEAEYQRRLSAKYFPEILCSLVSSTGASLEIISAEGTIANRKIVFNIIKAIEENIK